MDDRDRLALLAHGLSFAIDAVRSSKGCQDGAHAHADALSVALGLDMTRYWQVTAQN